mmetsp:Transcript_35554/g.83270  ORF Transcript_35554/g.83270 Transcript_35554/m.83270 type:complete len:126 (+) Transcript_35554:252-629(+)
MADRPNTTAGSHRGGGGQAAAEARKDALFGGPVMPRADISPRTLNQSLRGAPKVFLGAQEVDLGKYSKERMGVTIPRGWDQEPSFKTRTDLRQFRRKDAIPPPREGATGGGTRGVSRRGWTSLRL